MPRDFVTANFMFGELLESITAVTTELSVGPTMAAKLQLFGVSSNKEARLVLWNGQNDPEIVGAIDNPQTGTITVTRAQEGTTAFAWAAGTQVRAAITAEVLERAMQATMNLQDVLQAAYLPLVGGTLTGALVLPATDPTLANHATRKAYVDGVLGNKLPLSGGTMSGAINMNGNRLLALSAAVADTEPLRKLEFDAQTTLDTLLAADRSGSLTTSGTASIFTITSNSAITSLIDGLTLTVRFHATNNYNAKLNLNSIGDTPIHVVPGTVIPYGMLMQDAPVHLVYSTAYSAWLVVGLRRSASTGDIKHTIRTTAEPGWRLCDDGTIGNASSGATYASANSWPLYEVLYNAVSDTYAPVSGGRTTSAAADYALNKTIGLTKMLGRLLGVAGAGSGLTSRALGAPLGGETSAIGQTHLPSGISLTLTATSISSSSSSSSFRITGHTTVQSGAGVSLVALTDTAAENITTTTTTTGTAALGGSGTGLPIIPPVSFVNVMIAL